MRALRRVTASHEAEDRVLSIVNSILRAPLVIDVEATAWLAPNLRPHIDAWARQWLGSTLLYTRLLPEVLLAVGDERQGLALPLPPIWLKAAERQGLSIDHAASAVRLRRLAAAAWWQGLRTAGGLTMRVVRRNLTPPQGNYAVLFGLPAMFLPGTGRDGALRTLPQWFADREENATIETFCIETRASLAAPFWAVRSPFPMLPASALPGFVASAGAILLAGLAALAAGNWLRAIACQEAVILAWTRRLADKDLARSYVFNNSDYHLRPLWTYDVESRGSRVEIVFYSTNGDRLVFANEPQPAPVPGYETMTWGKYYVWTAEQAAFLREATGASLSATICGPIPLGDVDTAIEPFDQPPIAMFDVTPHKPMLMARKGYPVGYYTAGVIGAFIDDVATAAADAQVPLAVKQKRALSPKMVPARYRDAIDRLGANPQVRLIDPSCNASRLIEKSAAVVSFPFTSTAHIARHLGKPTAYYDPTGLLAKHQRAAHGVPILSGRKELAEWMKNI